MSEVEPWAEDHLQTLQALLPEPVRKDFTDDRLADVLRYLSDDETREKVSSGDSPALSDCQTWVKGLNRLKKVVWDCPELVPVEGMAISCEAGHGLLQ